MEKTAKIISAIFSPLLVPTYAIAIVLTTSILFVVNASSKIGVTAMTFAITGFLPIFAIFILYKLKAISDPGLNNKRERLVPYIIVTICYLVLAYYFHIIHSPAWLCAFVIGAAAATAISAIVNMWWKISAHAAGMAGLTALIFFLLFFRLNVVNLMPLLIISILTSGLVCSTRLILERHTLLQLLAGTVNGVLCVSIAMLLSF